MISKSSAIHPLSSFKGDDCVLDFVDYSQNNKEDDEKERAGNANFTNSTNNPTPPYSRLGKVEEGCVSPVDSIGKVSLSGEMVEAVMRDSYVSFVSFRALETAMWCSLASFLILGFGLVITGLVMAFTH